MKMDEQLSVLGEKYETLLNTDYVSVYHFEDTKIGYIYWKRQVSLEEYKEGFNAMIKKHTQDPSDYFISNIIKQGVSSVEKKDWFRSVAMEQAIKKGLKKAAVIMDNNPFREFYVNLIMGSTKKMGLPFKTFQNVISAKEWLFSN